MNSLDEPLVYDMNNSEHQEVKAFFQQCGLLQYLHTFISEGFESLSALYEITEEDMIAMGVKRGHRRLIQRDIANARGLPPPDPVGASPFKTSMTFYNPTPSAHPGSLLSATNTPPSSAEISMNADSNSTGSASSSGGSNGSGSSKRASDVIIQHQTKRKYRRRPKPDKNAPVKPPSAYIMFSNQVRAEMKDQNMSFAEIAKSIGEQWKNMSPEKKHSYEHTAMQAKDAYLIAMQQHRQTPEYKQYQEYLKSFKEKQAVANRLISRARRRSPSKKADSPSSTSSIADSSSNSTERDSTVQTSLDNNESGSSSSTSNSDLQQQIFLIKLPEHTRAAVCAPNLSPSTTTSKEIQANTDPELATNPDKSPSPKPLPKQRPRSRSTASLPVTESGVSKNNMVMRRQRSHSFGDRGKSTDTPEILK